MTETSSQLVIHWPRLGPYHLARLRGAYELFSERGAQVSALEIAGLDRTYGWKKEDAPTPFRRITVFPDRYYDDLKEPELERGIFRQLDSINPDAVAINGYGFPDSRACLEWCRARERKAILMTETTSADKPRAIFRELAKRLVVRQFSVAVCGGTRHRDYLLTLGMPAHRIFMKYDVVENAHFARANQDTSHLPGLERPEPFFLASSRFIARKNLGLLLTAYAQYRATVAHGSAWRLILLGSGEEEAALRRKVADEQIPDVTFAGFQQIEHLPSYYQRAGCFIHPALTEPWGLVVNEAMAAGLPVIVSSAVGCSADLVEDGANGFVFEPNDCLGLVRAMREISVNPQLQRRMGERSKEIINHWTPREFAESLWAAFQVPDEAYRVVNFGRRRFVAYRDSVRAAKLRRMRMIPPFTFRRGVALAMIKAAIATNIDRAWFRMVTLDDPAFISSDIAQALAEVRQRLNQKNVEYLFTWPAEANRRRTYAYALAEQPETCAFIKLSEVGEMEQLGNGFAMLQLLRFHPGTRFRFPRPLTFGSVGKSCFHVAGCVPLNNKLRSKRFVLVDPAECISSYAGPTTVLSPEQLAERSWMRRFWRVIDPSTKFARLIEADQAFPWNACRVHGDLTVANLISAGDEIWVLDWELSDQMGPHLTDYVTFFLGQRQRRLIRDAGAVFREFQRSFLLEHTEESQRDARLALAYLYAVGSGLGKQIVNAWNGAPDATGS